MVLHVPCSNTYLGRQIFINCDSYQLSGLFSPFELPPNFIHNSVLFAFEVRAVIVTKHCIAKNY